MTDNPEPPSGRVRGPSRPADDQVTVAAIAGPGGRRRGGPALPPTRRRLVERVHRPPPRFMRWIVATTRPDVTVSLGNGEHEVLQAMRRAVADTGAGARYIAVRTGERPTRRREEAIPMTRSPAHPRARCSKTSIRRRMRGRPRRRGRASTCSMWPLPERSRGLHDLTPWLQRSWSRFRPSSFTGPERSPRRWTGSPPR